MKKYLFFALALLGMASCAKDDLSGGNKPHHNGEVEESYIAINLMAADSGTRGTSGTGNNDYEVGTDAERVVNTAYFFFFDAQGNPFYVNESNAPATIAPNLHAQPKRTDVFRRIISRYSSTDTSSRNSKSMSYCCP